MKSTSRERDVKASVREILDAPQLKCWWFMPVPTGYGKRGVPDFIVCIDGYFLTIETKADKSKKPTMFQEMTLRSVLDAKGFALIIHDENLDVLKEVVECLNQDRADIARSLCLSAPTRPSTRSNDESIAI